MPYVSYDYYKYMFFGSKIPENSFLYYAARASEYLDSKFGENAADQDVLAKASCALAEIFYSEESEHNISSEKVGDYSVTFSASASQSKSLESRLAETAARYIKIVGWC
jgi:hypothetical protein